MAQDDWSGYVTEDTPTKATSNAGGGRGSTGGPTASEIAQYHASRLQSGGRFRIPGQRAEVNTDLPYQALTAASELGDKATFGLTKYPAALAQWAINRKGTYQDALNQVRDSQHQAAQDNPMTALAGGVGGSVLPMLASGPVGVTQGATRLAELGNFGKGATTATKVVADMGAQGLGTGVQTYTDSEDATLKDAAIGAGTGAALSGLGHAANAASSAAGRAWAQGPMDRANQIINKQNSRLKGQAKPGGPLEQAHNAAENDRVMAIAAQQKAERDAAIAAGDTPPPQLSTAELLAQKKPFVPPPPKEHYTTETFQDALIKGDPEATGSVAATLSQNKQLGVKDLTGALALPTAGAGIGALGQVMYSQDPTQALEGAVKGATLGSVAKAARVFGGKTAFVHPNMVPNLTESATKAIAGQTPDFIATNVQNIPPPPTPLPAKTAIGAELNRYDQRQYNKVYGGLPVQSTVTQNQPALQAITAPSVKDEWAGYSTTE